MAAAEPQVRPPTEYSSGTGSPSSGERSSAPSPPETCPARTMFYLWADGIHVNIRLEEHKLCLLVMIGVRADGRKELVALADGYRESAESWADLLRDRKCRARSRSALIRAPR